MKHPHVVGHRGFRRRFPDNSLAGFIAAAGVVDAVETDVRRSGDGKLVLSHDPVIAGLEVTSTPWLALAEIDLGEGHHPALLDESMGSLPELPLQIEVKNLPHEPGFEPDHRIALEVADRARPGDVVTSFNSESIRAVRRVFPGVVTGLCVSAMGDIDRAVEECVDQGHPVLVPSAQSARSGLIHAIDAGLRVFPWTVDEPGMVAELVALGVSGIITDDPIKVRAALEELT